LLGKEDLGLVVGIETRKSRDFNLKLPWLPGNRMLIGIKRSTNGLKGKAIEFIRLQYLSQLV
jgi:hypothetical protein